MCDEDVHHELDYQDNVQKEVWTMEGGELYELWRLVP